MRAHLVLAMVAATAWLAPGCKHTSGATTGQSYARESEMEPSMSEINESEKNARAVQAFYQSLKARDYRALAAAYHDDATFSDPLFPKLNSREVRAMWHMLCERITDLNLIFRDIGADGPRATAHWDATYTYPATGRRVENSADSAFEFRDGKILRQVDKYSLYRWVQMAQGTLAATATLTPLGTAYVQRKSREALDAFIAAHPEHQ